MEHIQNTTQESGDEALRGIFEKTLGGEPINDALISPSVREKIEQVHKMLDELEESYASLRAAKATGKTTKAWMMSELDSMKKPGEIEGEVIDLTDDEKQVVSDAIALSVERRLDEVAGEMKGE